MRGRFRRHGSLRDEQRQLAAQRSVVRAAVSRPSLSRPPFPALLRRMLLQTGRARASSCSPVREHSSRTAGGRVLRRVLRPACRCCVAARSRPHRPVRPPLCEPLSSRRSRPIGCSRGGAGNLRRRSRGRSSGRQSLPGRKPRRRRCRAPGAGGSRRTLQVWNLFPARSRMT